MPCKFRRKFDKNVLDSIVLFFKRWIVSSFNRFKGGVSNDSWIHVDFIATDFQSWPKNNIWNVFSKKKLHAPTRSLLPFSPPPVCGVSSSTSHLGRWEDSPQVVFFKFYAPKKNRIFSGFVPSKKAPTLSFLPRQKEGLRIVPGFIALKVVFFFCAAFLVQKNCDLIHQACRVFFLPPFNPWTICVYACNISTRDTWRKSSFSSFDMDVGCMSLPQCHLMDVYFDGSWNCNFDIQSQTSRGKNWGCMISQEFFRNQVNQ